MRVIRTATLGFLISVAASVLSAQSYDPVGPQTSVPISTVTGGGWRTCSSMVYLASTGTNFPSIKALCTGKKLMLACGLVGNATLSLLAEGVKTEIYTDPGDGAGDSHVVNGAQWYFNRLGTGSGADSWGFAAAGDTLDRDNCDTAAGTHPELRLCWHLQSGAGGYRCGITTDLNASTSWAKYVFTNDLFSDSFESNNTCGWTVQVGSADSCE